ncbi:unnamed protein product [Adineta steineri]|uniref:FAD-binding domain-containing protein n=1 Tax=Adineta steineri TaxID=433720 RepID=A0A815CHA2_9BILA|nr:unnamed protein product [Adineta steineri]CAF1101832.1 unnamed protein product [Adineta steineri]CAF1280330.1 unnamed protein product [Adineta steineri]
MDIIVVGGSLAGLFASLVLKRLGHSVHILERNPTRYYQGNGAGISVGPELQDYMDKFDKTGRNFITTTMFRRYLDIHGNEIHREDWIRPTTSWDFMYYILRANFDGLDSEYCKGTDQSGGKTIYNYDANVTDMKVDNDGITIIYEQKNQKKTIKADILLAADGASSNIRTLLYPNLERKYVGYVLWRGTILESEASESLVSSFVECFTFFHAPGIQFFYYFIPGKNGALDQGNRLINWGWYCNCEDPSEILTDCDGKTHRWTLPIGKVQLKVWENQKQYATHNLPPQFAQLVHITQSPIVQVITDVLAPQATYYGGRIVLLGDALAAFRPHTGAGASQAAFHALQLWENMKNWHEWMKNKSSYEDLVMEFARYGVQHGQKLGNLSQFGHYKVDGKLKMGFLPPFEKALQSEEDELLYDNST